MELCYRNVSEYHDYFIEGANTRVFLSSIKKVAIKNKVTSELVEFEVTAFLDQRHWQQDCVGYVSKSVQYYIMLPDASNLGLGPTRMSLSDIIGKNVQVYLKEYEEFTNA